MSSLLIVDKEVASSTACGKEVVGMSEAPFLCGRDDYSVDYWVGRLYELLTSSAEVLWSLLGRRGVSPFVPSQRHPCPGLAAWCLLGTPPLYKPDHRISRLGPSGEGNCLASWK